MHVERLERDDVMIVVQLPRFGAEAKISHGRERDGARLEAKGPFVEVLVLEFYFQRLFCVVGESDFGRDRCASETSRLDRTKLVILYTPSALFLQKPGLENRTEQPASSFASPS